MEKMRSSYFSGSWYPDRSEDITKQIHFWDSQLASAKRKILGGIVPHAGWFYSGIQSYDVIRRLDKDIDLLFVLGGHLAAGSPLLFWSCSRCETPLGFLPVHEKIRDELMKVNESRFDDRPDNTIEIQLPLIRYTLGEIPIVPVRVPADISSFSLVDQIINISSIRNLKISIIGSTDLTHYGQDYLFTPPESLVDPKNWVRKSDRKILTAMEQMREIDILKLAEREHSACSAGAAAALAHYAKCNKAKRGILLDYKTSLDKHSAPSFVGYGSVVYPC